MSPDSLPRFRNSGSDRLPTSSFPATDPEDFPPDVRPPRRNDAPRRLPLAAAVVAGIVAGAGAFVVWKNPFPEATIQDAVTERTSSAPSTDASNQLDRELSPLASRFPELGTDGRIRENPAASTVDENALRRSVRPDLAPPEALPPPAVAGNSDSRTADRQGEPREDEIWPKLDEVKPPAPAAEPPASAAKPPAAKAERPMRHAALPPPEQDEESSRLDRARARLNHRIRRARARMVERPAESRQQRFRLPDALRPLRPPAE